MYGSTGCYDFVHGVAAGLRRRPEDDPGGKELKAGSDAGSVSYRAKPGEHTFLLRRENWVIAKGTIEAGKTYYLWIEPRPGTGMSV